MASTSTLRTSDTHSEQGSDFVLNIKKIRDRARSDMKEGAYTSTYNLDQKTATQVLNQALATELVCMLRYKRHGYMAKGPNSEPIAKEFFEHAAEELAHAGEIAARIVQLGGEPDFNPTSLTERSHADYVEGTTLSSMIQENIVAERIAIDVYREMVRWFGDKDPTTRRMLEGILAKEEEHADELSDLLSSR